jgi:hypothetical protein
MSSVRFICTDIHKTLKFPIFMVLKILFYAAAFDANGGFEPVFAKGCYHFR